MINNSTLVIIETDSFDGKYSPKFKWLIDEVYKEIANTSEFTTNCNIKTDSLKKIIRADWQEEFFFYVIAIDICSLLFCRCFVFG